MMKKKILAVAVLGTMSLMFASCKTAGNVSENSDIKPLNEVLISAQNYEDTSTLAESVTPAIVGITSTDSTGESVGSGVCIASSGYILTNAHVLLNPSYVNVHLSNGEQGKATLVWQDESQDIAVIKTSLTLPYLTLAGIDDIKVGEDVLAVGTPLTLSLKHTFTKGIVSALNRTLRVNNLAGESLMQNLIQHDASLNPGNSGGPLINNRGEVVGINTLKISGGEGIGFAIPVKSIASALNNIISDPEYSTPYLGVYGLDSEIASYYGKTAQNTGVYIIDVSVVSPLKSCNMCGGEVITKFNGEVVYNMLDLRNALFKCKSGDRATIEYIQNGILKEVEVNLIQKEV